MSGADLHWTEEDLQLLVALHAEGLSARQIGLRVGRSRNSIIGKITRGRSDPSSPFYDPHCVPPQRGFHKRYKYREALPVTLLPVTTVKPIEPEPKFEPIAPLPEPESHSKLITAMRDNQCRYSTGENERGEFLFCGNETEGGSWCPFHKKLLTRPSVSRKFIPGILQRELKW